VYINQLLFPQANHLIKKTFMSRGGKRKGAGRPRGKGPWKETTKPLRIPLSLLDAVTKFMATNGYNLPLYTSRVPAGRPEHADDHVEKTTDLNSLLLKNPKDTFLLRVAGDSMMDAGIYENDMLTVDRKLEPRNGQIIVALVEGAATVKTFRKDGEGITLVPENERYAPIKILPATDFQILGVVTNVIRQVS
jgi:DNA polymerase V